MSVGKAYAPGEKTAGDENFPVASYLIAKPYRAAILAYYRFARASDDIADHPQLAPEEKVAQLNAFESTLLGHDDRVADAIPLREACAAGHITPRHGQDLLVAFRQDATKQRYANWDELWHYCLYSAAPVGRFVLDVHGESAACYPASDVICSVLQIINHLQDCKLDYQRLNRVYIPQDALARHGITEDALADGFASAELLACIRELTARTHALLNEAKLSVTLKDFRLAVEIETIERLAHRLLALLAVRDPLSERVHLSKAQMLGVMLRAALAVVVRRALQRR